MKTTKRDAIKADSEIMSSISRGDKSESSKHGLLSGDYVKRLGRGALFVLERCITGGGGFVTLSRSRIEQ